MEARETPRMRKYGESKTTRIMIATVPHVTAWAGRTKYQADGFLFGWVYIPWTALMGTMQPNVQNHACIQSLPGRNMPRRKKYGTLTVSAEHTEMNANYGTEGAKHHQILILWTAS